MRKQYKGFTIIRIKRYGIYNYEIENNYNAPTFDSFKSARKYIDELEQPQYKWLSI